MVVVAEAEVVGMETAGMAPAAVKGVEEAVTATEEEVMGAVVAVVVADEESPKAQLGKAMAGARVRVGMALAAVVVTAWGAAEEEGVAVTALAAARRRNTRGLQTVLAGSERTRQRKC